VLEVIAEPHPTEASAGAVEKARIEPRTVKISRSVGGSFGDPLSLKVELESRPTLYVEWGRNQENRSQNEENRMLAADLGFVAVPHNPALLPCARRE
jgi:hypothetical protein